MLFLGLDFETKDPYLSKEIDLGPGWVFSVNYPDQSLFYPIGYSYNVYDSDSDTISPSSYIDVSPDCTLRDTNIWRLKDILSKADGVVMHNSQYDLGCLRALGISMDIFKKSGHLKLYDTKTMAILHNSNDMTHLDNLLKKYLGEKKAKASLLSVLKKNPELAPHLKRHLKTFTARAKTWIYQNMDVIQKTDFNAMADYANQDTGGMMRLFRHYVKYKKMPLDLCHYYSHVNVICTDIRERGIRTDLAAVDRGIKTLTPVLNETVEKLYAILGERINLKGQKLKTLMAARGYKLPLTKKGGDSINKEWLEERAGTDPLCALLLQYRTVDMLLNQFLIKVRDMQQYSCPEAYGTLGYGRVFPQLNVLQARTGRFSSSTPNIQNIPKRNKEYAALCRAIYVPNDPNNQWYSLDWSNQEGRLQLHYAYKLGLTDAAKWRDMFLADPNLDVHTKVGEMMFGVLCPLDPTEVKAWKEKYRNSAKTIYLGKSYCMGDASTARKLGLPVVTETDWTGYTKETAGPQAKDLIDRYNNAFPYLKELQKACSKKIEKAGYIVTLGKRMLARPPILKIKGETIKKDYKAISLLIQGSACDQMIMALYAADEQGLKINCIVHDEINIEGTIQDAIKCKQIMESAGDLCVPMVAEVSVGENWGFLTSVPADQLCSPPLSSGEQDETLSIP